MLFYPFSLYQCPIFVKEKNIFVPFSLYLIRFYTHYARIMSFHNFHGRKYLHM